jgi:uncharacterized protein YjbI with pentapeptide repeats
VLDGVDLDRTFLYKAQFVGADLSKAKNLTQDQIDIACGDKATKLPAGLTMPTKWPCED